MLIRVTIEGFLHPLVWCEALHSEKFQMCNAITMLSPFFLYLYSYSLAPGVSFDLLQRLYKLEHHTVLCCSAHIRYMHCGPAGLSVMITPGPLAINQLLWGTGLVYMHSKNWKWLWILVA